jgi:hypothetical protein
VLSPRREALVDHLLQVAVVHRFNDVFYRRAEGAQGAQRPLAFVMGAAPTVRDRHHRTAVIVGGEVSHGAQLVRARLAELVVGVQRVSGLRRRVHQGTAQHSVDGMQRVLKGRDDSEIAAAAADGPIKIRVLGRARPQQFAVGSDDLSGDHVVAGQTMLSVQPANAAAEGQAGDAGDRGGPERCGETERLGGGIDLAQHKSWLRDGNPSLRVDLDSFEQGEVHHDPAFARGAAGDVVAAALDRQGKGVFASEEDGAPDIFSILCAGDQGRTAVDHGVEDATGVVVPGIALLQEFTMQSRPERADSHLVDCPSGRG